MAIFRPSKTGDAMGSDIGRRPGRMQLREIAKRKQSEEEGAVLKDESKVQKAARAFRAVIENQRRALGLA
jgi:hypothetical protein